MSKESFIKKNLKLSLEFDGYLVRHRKLMTKLPNKGWVVLTVQGDDAFNRSSIALVRGRTRRARNVMEARKIGKRWILRPLVAV